MLDGYAEGIALDESGLLSEGSGQNLFLVRDSVIYTPSLTSSILQGITRDTVLTLARTSGSRSRDLYSARIPLPCRRSVLLRHRGRITPVRSFDKITVGNGGAGRSPRPCSSGFSRFCAANTRIRTAG